MDSDTQVPIFTDTNLGTRIAISVLPTISARDFKKKLQAVHYKCFPESGEIEIYAVKVKRRSCYYHMTDSVLLKHAFEGAGGMWRLYVDARISKGSASKISAVPSGPINSVTITDTPNKKKSKERHSKESQRHLPSSEPRTGLVYDSSTSNGMKVTSDKCSLDFKAKEISSEMFSEVKSVSSILRRYFPSSNENQTGFPSPTSSEATSRRRKKKSHCRRSNRKANFFPKVSNQSPSNKVLSASRTNSTENATKGGIRRADFGERVVLATNNLTPFSSKKKSVIDLHQKSAHLIRQPEFDLSGSD